VGSTVKILKECQWKGHISKVLTDNKNSEEPYRVEGAGVYQWYREDEVERIQVWSLKSAVQDLKGRPYVSAVPATQRQCAWLEPKTLRKIEEETQTIIIVEHGNSMKSDGNDGYVWDSAAMSFVYVCGHDKQLRAMSADRVRRMVADILAEDAPAETEEAALKGLGAPLQKARTEAAAAAAAVEASEAAKVDAKSAPGEPEKKKLKGQPKALAKASTALATIEAPAETVAAIQSIFSEKSDPMKILRSLPRWPVNINEWGSLQDVIWSGHTALKDGWIRVWSRSKDSEYYFHPATGKTTFDRTQVVIL